MGYLDEEKKTLETFTEDFHWYLTGDMGSKDSEGFITLQGRKKVNNNLLTMLNSVYTVQKNYN